jgi:diacylglycerol kinase (ATP)
MIILLNPGAAGGTALEKWRRFSSMMPPLREKIDVCFLGPNVDLDDLVQTAASQGESHFIAAGGDGTVHAVLNALMRLSGHLRDRTVLGAVGLGSSNDFHKPFSPDNALEGIPSLLDFLHPRPRDIGRVSFNRNETAYTRYFLINASIGITAEGNALFNTPDRILAFLKRKNTPLAILYAALRALSLHRNSQFTIDSPGLGPTVLNLTNLGICKNPHFSGSLRYDVPVHYQDGNFQIFTAEEMGLVERVGLLRSLSRGRFRGLRHTRSWQTRDMVVSAGAPFPLELDGEIYITDRAEFTVLKQSLRVCS